MRLSYLYNVSGILLGGGNTPRNGGGGTTETKQNKTHKREVQLETVGEEKHGEGVDLVS